MKEFSADQQPQHESILTSYYLLGKGFISRLDIKSVIKTVVAALLSLYLSAGLNELFDRPTYLIASLWSMITAVIVLQASVGATYRAMWLRFIGVVIGTLIGAFFAFQLGAGDISIGAAILCSMIICSLLKIPDSYRLTVISVIVIMIPWKMHADQSPWIYAFFRLFDSCLGFASAFLVTHLFWPARAIFLIQANVSDRFNLFSQFFNALFKEKQRDLSYLQNLREEIETSFSQGHIILEESRAEVFNQKESLIGWITIMRDEEQLWENLLILESISYPIIEAVFDDELKLCIDNTFAFIDRAMKAMASKLNHREGDFDFQLIENAQTSLTEELIRYRATHRLQAYSFDVVADSFVFFYQLRKVLIILNKCRSELNNLGAFDRS